MIGEILGSYRILSLLGEGGMGRVYVAEHPLIGRKAAVKVLLEQYSANQSIVNRFFNEARTTALIKHPGLVDIFDFGYHASGCAFIVMELLEGQSLADKLKQQYLLTVAESVEIARQVANAVGAAHAKGIIHRDLKPDNIFLVPDAEIAAGYRVKILDFGIAKLAGDAGGNKTRTGAVLGTPAYMSPEQCRDTAGVDGRSDVYALGCILFQMACGQTPFVSGSAGDLLASHLRDPPPHPQSVNPKLPALLASVMLRMLAKSPSERPATMAAVVSQLEHATQARALAASRPTIMSVWRADDAGSRHQPRMGEAPSGSPPDNESPLPEHVPQERNHLIPTPVRVTVGGVGGTTLSSSIGERGVTRVPGPRRAALVVVAVVATIAVAGVTWFSTSRDMNPAAMDRTEATPAATPKSAPATAPAPRLAPSVVAPTGAASATDAPAQPAVAAPLEMRTLPLIVIPPLHAPSEAGRSATRTVTLHIDSVPSGAEIVGPGGTLIGTTPHDDVVPRNSELRRYTVVLLGHRDGVIELSAERSGSGTVDLKSVATPKPTRASDREMRDPWAPKPKPATTGAPTVGGGILDPFKQPKPAQPGP